MVFLGIGQGGALGLALMLPVLRGKNPGEVAGMAAMAMGVGYLIAAGGPGAGRRRVRPHGSVDVADHRLIVLTLAQWPAAFYSVKGKPT